MKPEPKEPKDLQVKIGTKEEARWTKVRDDVSAQVEVTETNLEIQKQILKYAEEQIAKEQSNSQKTEKISDPR